MAQVWDGDAWAPAAAPPAETGLDRWPAQSRLACTTPTSCAFLTGAAYPDGRTLNSVQMWDGRTWAATPAALGGAVLGVLQDIDCGSPTSCRAVGWIFGTGAVTVRWDGGRWTRESAGVLGRTRRRCPAPVSGAWPSPAPARAPG